MWLVWGAFVKLVWLVWVSRTGGTTGLAGGTLGAVFVDCEVLGNEIGAGAGTTCGTVVGATGGAGGGGGAIVKRGAAGAGLMAEGGV